jgi:hypothetical protein
MADKNLPSLLDRHWAESVLAIGAVVIAVASLWVAYDANLTNRQLVASQSWPYLEVYESDTASGPRTMTLAVTNAGIGPAKLESFELFWNGQPQRNPWQLLLDCCAHAVPGAARPHDIAALQQDIDLDTSTDEGVVVRAGEVIPLMVLKRNTAGAAIWDALHSSFEGHLTVRYCYCSVFNECWRNTQEFGGTLDMNPPEVRSCPRPQVPYDNRLPLNRRAGSHAAPAPAGQPPRTGPAAP